MAPAADRDKALDNALAQIERQFGKGSVMRLGDEARAPVEVIPTGSIGLDIALGIGGLPRGRIVEVFGPESSGKCLTADTYVWTDRGLETVAELFARCDQPATCTSRVTDVRECGVRVVNERGELETVAALTHNNRKPVVRIRLRSGRTVTATENHPLRVMNERGFIVWRTAGRIAPGDTVVSALFGAVEAAGGDGISEDEAVVLGYLVAEGSLGQRHAVNFTNWDDEVSGEYTQLVEQLFDVKVKHHYGKEHVVHNTAWRTLLEERYDLGYGKAADKDVPSCVRTGGHKIQRAFLSALFEGDGWIDPTSTVGLGTASERLAREVQLLLYGLGIPATASSKFNPTHQRDYWTVTINPSVVHRFLAEVGFRSRRRQEQVAANFRRSSRDPQFETEAAYTYEQVVAVEDAGLQPTFDVMVPETHSFLANGVLSHNTTVALHAVANAQRAGGIAGFIDAEHALDPEYAKKLGVDTDALLVSQPDTGEQALEIADMLIRSGALDVIVIDSVAALVPRAEIEGEMGDAHVGLQARLMSQALRKLTGALSQSKTTAIFINQLREKIGVFFGCFHYETRVTLADGTQVPIGKIVNQRMDVEVLSYDPETDRIQPRKIVNWFDNGPADEFLQFTVARSAGNGHAQFAATANHMIRTPGGWRAAGELLPGDRVMLAQQHRLSDLQWHVVLGSLLGDGNLSPNRPNRSGVPFRLGHGYLDWKVSLLGNIPCSRRTGTTGAVFADFTPLPELGELQQVVYFGDGKKHITEEYLKALTPLALAIWYMDDGSFTVRSKGVQQRTRGGTGRIEICVDALSPGSQERLVEYLRDTHGLAVQLRARGTRQRQVIKFTTAATTKFHELVAPYVHPSMEHKLLPRFRGRFGVEPQFVEPRMRPVPARILDIYVKPKTRSTHRFDIEVEGNHNYFVDGVMVHNSPETTTGGKALKFYASVRLDVRRIETLKDGTEPVGNRTRVKVVKNKCLAAGTMVFDPTTGIAHRIEDVVDQRLPISVAAAAKDGTLHVRPVTSWFDQGEQEVVGFRLKGGASLWATPDHKILTDQGWRLAQQLGAGDRVAQPRRFLGFGEAEPVGPDHARLLGYLIGDGYVGGKTPVQFINVQPSLIEDVTSIAATLGCTARRQGEVTIALSHGPGERNGVLDLCRRAGLHGKLAWEKTLPGRFFQPDVSADVAGNLLFGLLESGGWVSREQTGAVRVGYATTSEQLAHQIHWLLYRFGIVSSVRRYDPTGQRPSLIKGRRVEGERDTFEVRIAGRDNVEMFAEAVPMWGPRGRVLVAALAEDGGRRRGSQAVYLARELTEPILTHLTARGLTPGDVANFVGDIAGDPRGGLRQVLGSPRLRRDRVSRVADALDDAFLHEALADELRYTAIREVLPARRERTFDLEVEELHTLVADDVVVHNCAAPFKQAEFDILYGQGISREGGLIDMGVEHGFIRKSGAWYTYEGDQLGQGKENARAFLRDNADLADEIEKKIKEKLGVGPKLDTEETAPVDF